MSIVPDLPDPEYRAVRALSYSGAKTLLHSPELFAHETVHGRPDRTEFDVGHATHRLLLGAGPRVVLVTVPDKDTGEKIPARDYGTKAAREDRDRIRAAGAVPVTAPQLAEVEAMAAAVRAHPAAGKLLDPDREHAAELSGFWTDPETGTPQKMRLDWLLIEDDDGRPRIVDVKTVADVTRYRLSKAFAEYSYHLQDDNYRGGLAAHGVDAALSFVCVEKTPPHRVRVVELGPVDRETGARFMAEARRRYARFLEQGAGPDFPDPDVITLPRYTPTHPEDVLP